MHRPSLPAPRRRELPAVVFLPSCFLLLALLALLAPAVAWAQEGQGSGEPTFAGEANVLAIDLPVAVANATGAAPASLKPDELEIVEDGEPRPVVGVARLGSAPGAEPWRLVIYIDRVLASPATVKATALTLAGQVKELVALGTVEILVADPEPATWLAPTRDPGFLESALTRLLIELEGRGEIDRLRHQVLAASAEASGPDGVLASGLTVPELAAGAVAEEISIVERSQDNLLTWAARSVGEGPRALFLVASGFDLDPGEFYRQRLAAARGLASTPRPLTETTEAVSRALGACGWVVFPLAFSDFGEGPSENSRQFEEFRRRGLDGARGEQQSAVGGFTVPLGKRRQQGEAAGSEEGAAAEGGPLLTDPLPPLRTLAAATGGVPVARAVGLADVVASLNRWFRVTFQVSRDLDGRLHPVEVRARGAGLTTAAPGWVRSATPEVVAEARVRRIVSGDYEVGDLAVAARFRREGEGGNGLVTGILSTTLDLTGEGIRLPDPAHSPLRLTVAWGSEDGPPTFQHEILKDQDLSGPRWTREAPLTLPDSAEWVVVVVEELLSGSWGARDTEP